MSLRYTQILHWTMEKWEERAVGGHVTNFNFRSKQLGNFSQFKNHWPRTKVMFDHLRLSGGDISHLIHVNCHSPPPKKTPSPLYSYNTWVSWQAVFFGGCFGLATGAPEHNLIVFDQPCDLLLQSAPNEKNIYTPEIERIYIYIFLMAIFQAGGSHPRPLSFRGMYLNLLHWRTRKKRLRKRMKKFRKRFLKQVTTSGWWKNKGKNGEETTSQWEMFFKKIYGNIVKLSYLCFFPKTERFFNNSSDVWICYPATIKIRAGCKPENFSSKNRAYDLNQPTMKGRCFRKTGIRFQRWPMN